MLTTATDQKVKGHYITMEDITEVQKLYDDILLQKNLIKYLSTRTNIEIDLILKLQRIIYFKIKNSSQDKNELPDYTFCFYGAIYLFQKHRKSYIKKDETIAIEQAQTKLAKATSNKKNIRQKLQSIINEIKEVKENNSWKTTRKIIIKKHRAMFKNLKVDDDYFRKIGGQLLKNEQSEELKLTDFL